MTQKPKLPVAPFKPVTDDYFGTKVTDNYRYMEHFQDEEVQKWVKAQADFTINTLKQLPGRDAFLNRMMESVQWSKIPPTPQKEAVLGQGKAEDAGEEKTNCPSTFSPPAALLPLLPVPALTRQFWVSSTRGAKKSLIEKRYYPCSLKIKRSTALAKPSSS